MYDPTQLKIYECRVWHKVTQNTETKPQLPECGTDGTSKDKVKVEYGNKQMEPECGTNVPERESRKTECNKTRKIELDCNIVNEVECGKTEWGTRMTELKGEWLELKRDNVRNKQSYVEHDESEEFGPKIEPRLSKLGGDGMECGKSRLKCLECGDNLSKEPQWLNICETLIGQ